jgi:protein ImuB
VRRSAVQITEALRPHAPEIEPAREAPGVFFVDARGLGRLFPDLLDWARCLADALDRLHLVSTVVVGFTRFGTYALARAARRTRVLPSLEEEEAAFRAVPLARLDVDPEVRARLQALAVHTVDDLLRLPPQGLRERFGDGIHRLHRMAAGDLWTPLVPVPAEEPRARHAELESPDAHTERLLFLIKSLLDSLLADLGRRSEAAAELRLVLHLDDGSVHEERLRPAAPTLSAVQLLGLVRLRLETVRLTTGVVDLHLTAQGVRAPPQQVRLFRESTRDVEAAHRALARLRAEFGEDVVVRARVREGHLPAARFSWEPLGAARPALPAPHAREERPLVRRVYERPRVIPRPREGRSGWSLRGPYKTSGRWWRGEGVFRDYYFAETCEGEALWIYYDRLRRAWFLEGRVE